MCDLNSENRFPDMNINWFPGHMAKTRRIIKECLPSVDIVVELLDARIPVSSKNPEIDAIVGGKPTLTVLSKASLADPAVNREWEARFRALGKTVIFCDFPGGYNVGAIIPAIKNVLSEKLERYAKGGMEGRSVAAMVVGIPNVGKSTLINTLCGAKKAKAENRPGVTLSKQWLKTGRGVDFLDMPGVLWPKFEDKTVGENLALTGAIKDDILNLEQLAVILCERLRAIAPGLFAARYKLGEDFVSETPDGRELLFAVGKKRGCLVSGGEIDTERAARIVIEEFRSAKIGRISLERP